MCNIMFGIINTSGPKCRRSMHHFLTLLHRIQVYCNAKKFSQKDYNVVIVETYIDEPF